MIYLLRVLLILTGSLLSMTSAVIAQSGSVPTNHSESSASSTSSTINTSSAINASNNNFQNDLNKPWQQEAYYTMEIDMDAEKNRFTGIQKLRYVNNSPDTLSRVFYHLFFNAFQPGSMMDIRSRTIEDPDRRVRDRIFYYDDTEIGYQNIQKLTQDGADVTFRVEGTIMEVTLQKPILPGEEALFVMDFDAQVPLQTRRSGRDNREGIRFSMSQWYPKIAAYDTDGWHPNPYIGREFYAPFGRFDVKISIDPSYMVAATGYLQNAAEIGSGYDEAGKVDVKRMDADDVKAAEASTQAESQTDSRTAKQADTRTESQTDSRTDSQTDSHTDLPHQPKTTWHFVSDLQHDFMWAADPDYRHVSYPMEDGPMLRFFYQDHPLDISENDPARNAEAVENWKQLPEYTAKAFRYLNENYGVYPYDEYLVIQGGDGGMEYTMGTLITGNRSLYSLVGVTVHEIIHAWYEGVIANNETTDQWIDEGFTVYLYGLVMQHLFPDFNSNLPLQRQGNYLQIVRDGVEEPMHLHADHYERNRAYSVASYTKGALYLQQLGYILGEDALKRGLNRLYTEWAFRHPTGKDVLRIMERESGMVLDWYHEYWVTTVKTIDYGIERVVPQGSQTLVQLKRHQAMPMPLDLEVEFTDGTVEHHYIPLRIMWGEKPNEHPEVRRIIQEDWRWVEPEFELTLERPAGEIKRIEIDPSMRLVDINRENNVYPKVGEKIGREQDGGVDYFSWGVNWQGLKIIARLRCPMPTQDPAQPGRAKTPSSHRCRTSQTLVSPAPRENSS